MVFRSEIVTRLVLDLRIANTELGVVLTLLLTDIYVTLTI
jgi:hypothetical protein